MDNEQYIQRALTWKSTGKINGWFRHTSQKELEKRRELHDSWRWKRNTISVSKYQNVTLILEKYLS